MTTQSKTTQSKATQSKATQSKAGNKIDKRQINRMVKAALDPAMTDEQRQESCNDRYERALEAAKMSPLDRHLAVKGMARDFKFVVENTKGKPNHQMVLNRITARNPIPNGLAVKLPESVQGKEQYKKTYTTLKNARTWVTALDIASRSGLHKNVIHHVVKYLVDHGIAVRGEQIQTEHCAIPSRTYALCRVGRKNKDKAKAKS